MGITRQTLSKHAEIISASEIGQFHYCSIAWYLRKCGYEPVSTLLEAGAEKHAQLGQVLDDVQTGVKRSKLLAFTGFVLMIISVFIIIFEVIL